MAGKPLQALEQPTMCSCPPSQGGSREKSSSCFSFPIQVAPAIPSPDKPGGWAACFPGSGEYKQEHHGNPQSVHDIATGTKLFQVQKQNPDPFLTAVEDPGDGHQPRASHTEDAGPQPKDRRRREETECETCSDSSHPSPEMALQAWRHPGLKTRMPQNSGKNKTPCKGSGSEVVPYARCNEPLFSSPGYKTPPKYSTCI